MKNHKDTKPQRGGIGKRSALLRPLLLCVFVSLWFHPSLRADEPFFKKGDVIALVGGEDMVAMSEFGYLELLLTRALPGHRLKFRNLAWEGDTVFEQRRDLNFPTWEQQLDQTGATVVICQFGQMESLAGKEKLPEFVAAYEKLIERFSGGGKRRVVLLSPFFFAQSSSLIKEEDERVAQQRQAIGDRGYALLDYAVAIHFMQNDPTEVAAVEGSASAKERPKTKIRFLGVSDVGLDDVIVQRDGLHLNEKGHRSVAYWIGLGLHPIVADFNRVLGTGLDRKDNPELHRLLDLIITKNRLWFDYWRVQNWAFLAGDRTEQPSSRDHIDRTKRWFPAERERFLPLIEAKEQEIADLAAKLATP